MATATRVLGTADDGAVEVDLTYDDATAAVASVSLTNNGASGTMTLTLFDKTTGAVTFGPTSRSFGTGTVVQSLAHLHLKMVAVAPNKFAPDGWALPFDYNLAWSTA